MAEAYYEPTPATDGATMNPVPGAVFQVFEIADTTFATPLSLRVGSGNPTTSVTASDTLATLPGVYVTSPNYEHIWKSGTFEWRRDSIDGAKKAIEDAKVAASNSASASDASALAAANSAQAATDAAALVDAPADTVMANTAANPATAFATQLSATVASEAPKSLRKRVVGSGNYKAGAAEVLQPFWAALASRNTAPVDIVYGPGTSLMAGTGATGRSARWIDRLTLMLRNRFPVNGVIGGAGYGPASGQLGGATAAGSPASVNYGLGNRSARLENGTQTLTWGGQVGDKITVYGVALTAADAITVVIDGGAATTVTPGATGAFSQTFTVTRARHTVVVGWSAGTPVVKGIFTADGDADKGIRMWDNSKGGSKTTDWLTSAGGSSDWLNDIGTTVTPDLVVIDQMANDVTNVSPTVYGTQLQAIVDAYRTKTTAPIVLWLAYRRGSETPVLAPHEEYVAQAYTVAANSSGVCVVDFDPLVDVTNASGWLFDAYHPNNNGYEALAAASFDLLSPAGVSTGTFQTTAPYTTYSHEEQVRGALRVYGEEASVVTSRVTPAPNPSVNIHEVTDSSGAAPHLLVDKNGRTIASGFTARGNQAGSAAASLSVDGNAGQLRDIVFATTASADAAPSARWIMRVDASAETGSNAGSNFLFMSRTDTGGSLKTIFSVVRSLGLITIGDGCDIGTGTTTGTKIGTSGTQKLGFYGATPIVRPTGTPAAATDLATALTLVNDLRAKLLSLGVIA